MSSLRYCIIVDMKKIVLLAAAALSAGMVCAAASSASDWPILKTYSGEHLRRIKMPLGGIGTGTISLSGNGSLVDWEIRNIPAKGYTPNSQGVASGFWIRTEDAAGNVSARLLEGPIDTSLYEGEYGSPALNHGFPRFPNCRFQVAYPLAQVELSDPTVPVCATLEAMNPLVKGDPDASGIPAALFRWRLTNSSAGPIKVSVLGLLVSPVGLPGPNGGRTNLNARISTDALAGISVGDGDVSKVDNTRGRVALVVRNGIGDVTTAFDIGAGDWRTRIDRFWRRFVSTGRAEDVGGFKDSHPMGAICVSFTLAAGETLRVPFAVGWRYPHRPTWWETFANGAEDVGNHYATVYPTADSAADRLLSGLEELEAKTVAFVREVFSVPAPDVVKEAALFNLSTFRTETCFRTADGHFFGWEGCADTYGSCYGSCTHVWGYEHALIDIWPSLAKDMTELQFGPQMDQKTGHISFRVGLPLATKARRTIACADGQMQCIIKAYENWHKTGDDVWMRGLYPKIRKSMEFCWIPGGWDSDKDGVMEGCQHNTMDVEYYGPNPQMEFLYIAALRAIAAMADVANDAPFAVECRALAERGGAWTEKNLFNGEYYEHRVVPPKGPIADGISVRNAKDLSNPDFQLAAGCLVDQLLGDYASRHVGLGAVANEANAKTALKSILRLNASSNVGATYNCGRDYAFPEEEALKMAWYPKGKMPERPFPYYGENMTGFEYVVAANLAQRGDFSAAEKVVRDIRSRYDGRKRSPFNEAECGHHYVRALAAWTVLEAYRK